MTLKKNWTLRAAVLMLALVLITSCFVGGTFAKYVTEGIGGDVARVAKFGVTVTATDNSMFKTTYETDDQQVKAAGISASVKTTTHDNLVAPGTNADDVVMLSIAGKPEVAVNVKLTIDDKMDVFLKAGTYPDFTTAAANDTFTLAQDYHPVVFTLKQNGEVKKTGTLHQIKEYLDGENGISVNCEPNVDLSTVGTLAFSLSWEWAFEGNDQADTLLGNLAASNQFNGVNVAVSDYSTAIAVVLKATVTQID